MLVATRFVIRSVIMVLLPDNSERLVDIIYEKRRLGKGPSIAVIGGGHGLSVLLRGSSLQHQTCLRLSRWPMTAVHPGACAKTSASSRLAICATVSGPGGYRALDGKAVPVPLQGQE